MGKKTWLDFGVGAFIVLGLSVAFFLAGVVGGAKSHPSKGYTLSARFEDVTGLTQRAVIRMSGVIIGEVESIKIIPSAYNALVKIRLYDEKLQIPKDSSAGIYTEGILGAKYVSITPGYSEIYLGDGEEIVRTQSAVILENLLSKAMMLLGDDK